ncbi:MAG: IS200/IS605 family transposase, partial [Cyclobacteriaceae bacterium]|nr:IS200/IS605 family transposase [Cyclobacteriaceae bacterium]
MKSGTFTQVYIHIVFSVKYRKYLIHESWEDQLYKYITGIVQGLQNKMLAINGMPDHIHILVRMRPHVNISELVREIKKGSVNFMVENKLIDKSFQWQNGYGA